MDEEPVGQVSYQLTFGTYEDALRLVGATSEPRTAATAVSGARIQLFAAMVRDGNRSYWDAEFARQTWGGCRPRRPCSWDG